MRDPKLQPEHPKSKKRVSHRKELAVVTLAMVASISGVGGLLAVNQPASSQLTATVGSAAKPTITAHTQQDTSGKEHVRLIPSSWRGDDGREIDDDGDGYAVVRPARVHEVSNAAPSFSPRLHKSPSAVSQGSPPAH